MASFRLEYAEGLAGKSTRALVISPYPLANKGWGAMSFLLECAEGLARKFTRALVNSLYPLANKGWGDYVFSPRIH